jgi:hypothetical protein
MSTEWLTHNLKHRTAKNNLPFQVSFNFQPFSPCSFEEEAKKVCLELHKKYGNKLVLAFSGGSDSEYVLKTFLELNLPITPVIVSCPFNQKDIKPAFEYCQMAGIEPKVLEYGQEYLYLAKEKIYSQGLISPIGLTPLLVYDYVKSAGGVVVSGQGEPLPITIRNGQVDAKKILSNYLQLYEFEFYLDVYSQFTQPLPFFCYNQSIFYSYMKEIDTTTDIQTAKCKLYKIPYREKTYWSEEIYENIRKNSTVLPVGIKCNFSSNKILENLENLII